MESLQDLLENLKTDKMSDIMSETGSVWSMSQFDEFKDFVIVKETVEHNSLSVD